MKKLNSLFALIFVTSLFLFSCSDDDNNNTDTSSSEDREIPVTELTNGITISGAKLKTGTPPSPTGNLDFQISTVEQQAFLNNGFNISFTSTGNITGAYIQFKDVNGNNADGYFDIPSTAFGTDNGGKISGIRGKKSTFSKTKINEEDLQINVDFEESIAPGKFCYAICIYDADGNISQIQEICVEVDAWGGNASIADEWIFDREEPEDIENGDTATINCQNGSTLTDIPYNKVEKDDWILVLNENGTYYEIYEEKGARLDIQESEVTCSPTYNDIYEYHEKYSGNWAYNEEAKTITVIDFKYEDLLDSNNNEEYPEGYVYFENTKIEVISGELVITDTYNDGNGDIVIEKIIFKRK